jgi:hypothetical protein
MSFFKDLFSRKITYLEYFNQDKNYSELIHVFGARRVMPEDGDSFDIWHHIIINTTDFSITKGINQRGNEFSIKSNFAQRALEEMSRKLNRNLAFDFTAEEQELAQYESEEELVFPTQESIEVILIDSLDTDTGELPKLPLNGIVLTTYKNFSAPRFTVQLYRNGVSICSHSLKGDPDYFRKSVFYPQNQTIVFSYRKEMSAAIGGMAFFALNMSNGELLHDGFIA